METSLIERNKGKGWELVAPWLCGLGVSLLLFIAVILSGRPSDEPPPIEVANMVEEVVLPPPPVIEVDPPPVEALPVMPVEIDFHNVPSKESIALLDVKIVPQKDQNLLSRIKFDLDSLKVTMEDVNANFVYNPSEVDDPPVPIYQPFPVVPSKLRSEKEERVRVMFFVNEKGRVDSPYVIETSDPKLNELVLQALVKWKYIPARKNNKKVCCWVRTSLIFSSGTASPFNV